jgi:hypothetical protein
MTKSTTKFMVLDTKKKSIEVKLNEVMREFEFIFHKMDDEYNDFYTFDLYEESYYVIFIDNKKIELCFFKGDNIIHEESFKSVKSLRNRLCEAI